MRQRQLAGLFVGTTITGSVRAGLSTPVAAWHAFVAVQKLGFNARCRRCSLQQRSSQLAINPDSGRSAAWSGVCWLALLTPTADTAVVPLVAFSVSPRGRVCVAQAGRKARRGLLPPKSVAGRTTWRLASDDPAISGRGPWLGRPASRCSTDCCCPRALPCLCIVRWRWPEWMYGICGARQTVAVCRRYLVPAALLAQLGNWMGCRSDRASLPRASACFRCIGLAPSWHTGEACVGWRHARSAGRPLPACSWTTPVSVAPARVRRPRRAERPDRLAASALF